MGILRFWNRDEFDPKLVTSIFEGLTKQVERGAGEWTLHAKEIGIHVDEGAVDFDNPPADLEVYIDTVSLDMPEPVKVKVAREEVDFDHEFGVYRKIPRASAVGGQFVTVKRIDVHNGR